MNPSAATPVPVTDRRLAAGSVALAAAATAAMVAAWLALAASTGLIFHFLPGATFLAGACVFRWREGGRRATGLEFAATICAGGLGTVIGLAGVTALERELDSPLLTALVVLAGASIATASLRRASPVGGAADQGPVRED